jgi:hypothetical protein
MKFITPRRLVAVLATVLVLAVMGWVVRPWLGAYAIRVALGMAGATAIKFHPVAVSPWRVVVEDLQFRLQSEAFTARRLTLERPRWWRASLGQVRIEEARVTVSIDGSDSNPWSAPSFTGEADPAEPMSLPVESLVLNGEVTVRAAAQPDQRLTVKLEGAPKGKSDWVGTLVVEGEGVKLEAGGTLLAWGTELDFQVQRAELDLHTWQGFIQRNLLLPGGPWTLGGRLTGTAEGHVTGRRFAATARVSLREGRMRAATRDVTANGAEADIEFSDLWKFRTKSGQLRVQELRAGRLSLREVTADFGLWGAQTIAVNGAAFSALGGRAEVDPFKYYLNQREAAVSLRVENLEMSRILELAPGAGVTASGRVSGILPLQIQSTGVRLDAGHLALSAPAGELEYNAATLLRSGATISDGSLAVLKAAGSKPVRLRLDGMRLDIRQPDIPLGCSARAHVTGQTDDGPVEFDFNVNGAIESYLDVL